MTDSNKLHGVVFVKDQVFATWFTSWMVVYVHLVKKKILPFHYGLPAYVTICTNIVHITDKTIIETFLTYSQVDNSFRII